MGVGENLELDVAGIGQVLLQVHVPDAEGVGGDGLGGCEGVQQLLFTGHDGHPDASPASRGLDDHGITEVASDGCCLRRRGDALGAARDDGNAGLHHLPPGGRLVAHEFQHPARRPYEPDPFPFAGGGEARVLGQEAVTGMDRVGAASLGGIDDLLSGQVALRSRRRPDEERLVGVLGEEGVLVRLGIHGHRANAHLAAGAHDADGYLAPVGDEDLLDHVTPLP